MNQKNNQKYCQTHLDIQDALIELSKTKNNITVTDICQYCHINRSSFYLHYEDIIDLLKQIQSRMNDHMMRLFNNSDPSTRIAFSKESYVVFARHVQDNQSFYRIFFKNNITFPIKEGFQDAWDTIIVPYFHNHQIYDKDIMLMRFICFQAGFTNVFRYWVENNCQQTSEEIANIIFECTNL